MSGLSTGAFPTSGKCLLLGSNKKHCVICSLEEHDICCSALSGPCSQGEIAVERRICLKRLPRSRVGMSTGDMGALPSHCQSATISAKCSTGRLSWHQSRLDAVLRTKTRKTLFESLTRSHDYNFEQLASLAIQRWGLGGLGGKLTKTMISFKLGS